MAKPSSFAKILTTLLVILQPMKLYLYFAALLIFIIIRDQTKGMRQWPIN